MSTAVIRRAGRALAAGACAAGLAAAMSGPASAAPISSGHVDVLDIDWTSTATTLDLKTYSPANDDVATAGSPIVVPATSTTTVPTGSAWSCLGAGQRVYVLPQTSTSGVVWAGWNASDVPASAGPVQLSLVSSTVPSGGRFALYQTSLGSPSVKLNSSTTSGCTVNQWPGGIGAGTHGHGNWTFSTTGTYTLVFKATTKEGRTSGNVTYTFQVG
ncbi:MAG: choice-of-anchor M domain-containing protein [Dermatophilaceae bacterium]